MNVTFSPLLAWSLIWIFGVIVLTVTAYSIYHRGRGSLLRMACGVLLIAALQTALVDLAAEVHV